MLRSCCSAWLLLFSFAVHAGELEDGLAAYHSKDYPQAFIRLQPLAELGVPAAQFTLGEMYRRGRGFVPSAPEALPFLQQAATANYPPACIALGEMFEAGEGGKQDSEAAAQWFEKIAEQAARKEHENVIAQAKQSSDMNDFLAAKFTSRDLHHWMQGELSRLHRSYFDFAIYTARKAESAVKNELMRPELDGSNFVRNDYWDGGRRGLLAGEALHLDLKRLELAYAENNKYEDLLSKPVSLRRLDPLALLQLQATGECTCAIPEWIFDLDRPGHYMRRIRRVGLAVPGVVGPYSALAARLNLMRSTLRKAPGGAIYARQGNDDPRFKDYGTAAEVTVSLVAGEAAAEAPSVRDQLLPYEGHGVDSEWRIKLPKSYRQFDYRSASDAILQIQYSARSGGDALASAAEANLDDVAKKAEGKPFAIMISITEEFPFEWDRFVSGATPDLQFDLSRDLLPYLVLRRKISLLSVQAHVIDVAGQQVIDGTPLAAVAVAEAEVGLNNAAKARAAIAMPKDAALVADRQVRPHLIVRFAVKT